MDLSEYRVPGSDCAYYIPDFVSEEEEEYLVRKVCSTSACLPGENPIYFSTRWHLESVLTIAHLQTLRYHLSPTRRPDSPFLDAQILETPQPKWRQLANRRLQTWGMYSHPHAKFESTHCADSDLLRRRSYPKEYTDTASHAVVHDGLPRPHRAVESNDRVRRFTAWRA